MVNIDSYSKLVLHAETLDNSASSTHTQTLMGGCGLSSVQSRFGGSSFKFNAVTGDYLISSGNADYNFGGGDFTIDYWVYQTSAATPVVHIAREFAGTYPPFLIGYGGTEIYMSSNGTSWDIAAGKPIGNVVLAGWQHIEIGRQAGTFYAFRNGVLQSTWVSELAFADVAGSLAIGAGQSGNYMNGYIDEIHVSKGVCRHTANFTPPSAPYAPSPLAATGYGQVVATATANNSPHIDLVDTTGVPCDHYLLEFYHVVSDIETPPDAQSGALLTAYVSFDGGATFKTDAHYNNNGTSLFAGEDNPTYISPSPYGLGTPQTLNLGLRLSIDTGDTPAYGATGSADIYNAGGHTIYKSISYKGALGGNSNQIRNNGTLPINQRGQPWFGGNGTQYFHWAIPVTYAGHYDGAPGQRPNAFRLKMNGGQNTIAIIQSGTFKLRRMV